MATIDPGALDVFTNPAPTDGMTLPSHSDQHTDANDAIEAIEAELGTNPSGAYSTVAARLADLSGGGGGGGVWELDAAGDFSAVASVTLGLTLDPDYEYELELDVTSTGSNRITLVGRSSGADVTSGVYYLAGWAKSWTGGYVAWGANAVAALPLDYEASERNANTLRFRRQLSTRWVFTVDCVVTAAAYSGLGRIEAAIDDLKIIVSTGTMSGAWSLTRRKRAGA